MLKKFLFIIKCSRKTYILKWDFLRESVEVILILFAKNKTESKKGGEHRWKKEGIREVIQGDWGEWRKTRGN